MGGSWDKFEKFGKKVVKWVGNCIEKIVDWWSSHKEAVNQITINFIIENQNVIIKSNDKQTFIEAMAIKKQKSE